MILIAGQNISGEVILHVLDREHSIAVNGLKGENISGRLSDLN